MTKETRYRKVAICLMILLSISGVFIVPFYLSELVYKLYNNIDHPNRFDITLFLQIASWLQVVVGWITLVFIAVTAFGVTTAANQLYRDRMRDEWEIYAPLISNEMMSTKRFLASNRVEDIMKNIEAKRNAIGQDDGSEEYQGKLREILENARRECEVAEQEYSWPLLNGT